jgi:outer membrane protein OmpA-like peptidoglycan-associated protein
VETDFQEPAGCHKTVADPAAVRGFGVVAPVACSDSDQALEKNRRVEVWLRQ